MANTGTEKVVRVASFPYTKTAYALGEEVKVHAIAARGERITIENDYDLERGERLGAFFGDDAEIPANLAMGESEGQSLDPAGDAATMEGEVDPRAMDHDELVIWVQRNNIQGILAEVGQDAAFADRVLTAEDEISEGNPRKGLNDPLTRLIEEVQGSSGSDDDDDDDDDEEDDEE